jgi:hypothetical protein
MHPSARPKIMERREREFSRAVTADDVAKLQKKWEREDRAVKAAKTIEARQLAELRQRVRSIESFLFNEAMNGLSEELVDLLADILVRVRREIENNEIAALRREIEDLKRTRVKYCGVFEHGTLYPEGAMVTRGGSVWYATRETREAPGEGQTSWTLAVKRGGAV